MITVGLISIIINTTARATSIIISIIVGHNVKATNGVTIQNGKNRIGIHVARLLTLPAIKAMAEVTVTEVAITADKP